MTTSQVRGFGGTAVSWSNQDTARYWEYLRRMWQDGCMATSSPAMTASATSQDALHALLREVLPPQGAWSDEEYLWLTDRCNHLIEFTDRHVQELPMPTFTHQAVLAFL